MDTFPDALLTREVEAMCKRYRVEPGAARTALVEAFAAQPDLVAEIAARHPTEDVTRMRAYKNAVKAARKRVYYHLRRYRRGDAPDTKTPAGLLQTHISTAERDQIAFFKALFDLIAHPASIIDLGCGLQPLAYPFNTTPQTTLYVALDRDAQSITTLNDFAPKAAPAQLVAQKVDLSAFAWDDIPQPDGGFDLALMLKLIPVMARQDRDALANLAAVPARRILVTGNLKALTRHEDIRAREDKTLRAFIELSGRRVEGAFEAPGEFGYLLG